MMSVLPRKPLPTAFLASLLLLLARPAAAADKDQGGPPRPQPLWPGGAPGARGKTGRDVPTVTVYRAPTKTANGAAVVICPGGGYGGLAMDHEGHQVARWLNSIGVTGVILQYRHAPYRHPYPLLDAQRALRFTRAHAQAWGIDPHRVGILGFSAGGHLASTAGTHFDAGQADAKDPIDRPSCRPDFLVLVYPVITFTAPYMHRGSRDNLLGKDPPRELIELLSNEKQVTARTPPTFLVHTSEDTGVPPENSIAFYEALRKARVPAEIHVFEKGNHGLGLGPKGSAFARWPGLCEEWLKGRKMLAR